MDNNSDHFSNSFLNRTYAFINCCDAFAELYREAGKVIPAGEVKDIYNAIFDDYFVK